jgi:predicted nucleotidyltransferase
MTAATGLTGLERLKISTEVRRDLGEFISRLMGLYKEDLVSITAFGSAVSGDYMERASDVNLLVVYSDLNIANLTAVARLSRLWLKKRRFAPRFLSVRNLTQSARFFQIDLLEMRQAYEVLYGKDVLAGLEVLPAGMLWQLSHEIKRMRMRIKQQFWRAAGDPRLMRTVLTGRFSSLLHLMRALLFLQKRAVPVSLRETAEVAARELKIDAEFARQMLALKAGELRLNSDALIAAFPRLMEMIRVVDGQVDLLAV